MYFAYWLFLAPALAGAPYEPTTYGKVATYACTFLLRTTATWCLEEVLPGACACSNKNMRASFAACLHYAHQDSTTVLKQVAELCEGRYNVSGVTPADFRESYQYYQKHAVNASGIEGFNITVPVEVPIKITQEAVDLHWTSYMQFMGNYMNSLYYGSGLLGYWLLVLLLAAIFNWAKFLAPGLTKITTGRCANWARKHAIAAVHRRKTDPKPLWRVFDCLVPTRMETAIVAVSVAIVVVFMGVNVKTIPNDPVFVKKSESLARQLAIRGGILTSFYMPLLILFAGRNNFLQWLTKWNFATFVMFHRWIGRIAFLLVLVHSVGYTIELGSYYTEEVKERYMIFGVIGTTSGGIILVQGLLFLRRRWYEIFLLLHIALAVLFIAGAWIHTNDLGYVWFYYATSAVWVADRVARIARIAYFGCPFATVLHLSKQDTIKVVVAKPAGWKNVPGGHAFVHFLRPTYFWQSHPFTYTETSDSIVFYCKIKGGVTHGLYRYLANMPGRTAQIRVAVEGPYGEPTPARHYDSAVFIAGGNGIPGIYSEAFALAQKTPTNRIQLMWIIRDVAALSWFTEELAALKDTGVEAVVYVTKPAVESASSDDKGSEKGSEKGLERPVPETLELSHVEFRYGRPEVEEIVKEEIAESRGSTCFVACGHPVMVDDLRYYVSQNLHPSKRVDFFEQLQVWA